MSPLNEGNMIEMALDKVMPELMGNTETLEPFATEIRRIENPEGIAVADQHAGHPFIPIHHWPNDDFSSPGQALEIDRKTEETFISKKPFGLLHQDSLASQELSVHSLFSSTFLLAT